MKRVFYFLIIVFFASCSKKEGGNLVCTMKYNLSIEKNVNVTKAYSSSDRYTQFGDYITSITPSKFLIKFLCLKLCSTWKNQNNNLEIIDNNKLDWTSTDRIADFNNNSTVNVDIDGKIAKDVEMIYMVSVPMFYYQEFELPQQYYSFNIDSGINNLIYLNCGGPNIDYPTANAGIGGVKEGLIVKCSNNALTAPIFDTTWINNKGFQGHFPEIPQTTVFGNTDSTFIFSSTGTSKDDPLGAGGDIIRSNKFNSITLHAIAEGETKTISGIMTFNSTNLIQIYAGKDNIPYTSDDIFVYAPRFWERLSVSLTSN